MLHTRTDVRALFAELNLTGLITKLNYYTQSKRPKQRLERLIIETLEILICERKTLLAKEQTKNARRIRARIKTV